MKVFNVGYNYTHPTDFVVDRPSGSGDYILLVVKSEAFFVLNGIRKVVPANSVIIFKKGTPQLYGATEQEYVNDWIHFDVDEDEEAFILKTGVLFDTVFSLHETVQFSQLIKKMFLECYSQNRFKEASLKRYFELIILKLAEETGEKKPQHEHAYYPHLFKLRNNIRLAPQNKWLIDDICKDMNLSRSYLQHLYKQFFGISIVAEVQNCRIEYAQFLISTTNMKISNISKACGYENDVHFMRVFKKRNGITPGEYRQKTRISSEEVRKSRSKQPFKEKI